MKEAAKSPSISFKKKLLSGFSRISFSQGHIATAMAAGVMLLGFAKSANALEYSGDYNGQKLTVNLDVTLQYSTFYRVNQPSAILTSNVNGNDSDLNFRHGFVSNQIEALPVFDLKYGDFGAHVSGEVYLNTVYLQKNQNNSPSTINQFTPADNRSFTSATRNVNGQNARFLDAFLAYHHSFEDGQTVALKVGRQTLLWGQSLFFTNNGIAAGQAPVDIILAQDTPNAQAQQVFLPVGQVVATYQPGIGGLTFQAYYQFEYQHDNFQGVGAYFNSSDILDRGGQRLILAPDTYLFRSKDVTPPVQNGQFGFSVQDTLGKYDVGVYALRYDSKVPEVYGSFTNPVNTPYGVSAGTYSLVYPRDIQLYGASLGTTIGASNVGAEISGRRNMPLVSGLGTSTPANPGNANSDPLYAVGNTLAAQASMIYVSPGIPLDPGGVSVLGEVEYNHVLNVTANKSAMVPGRQASAAAFDVVLTPTYYSVLPHFDLAFPIGLKYNFLGRSQIDSTMNHGTGTFNVGVQGTYNETWIASLTYNDYFGKADPSLNPLADRGYVSFNVQHTF